MGVAFLASFFGMYKYGQYKNFSDLTKQGNQYMLQKNYDKAVQLFKQALIYKNDKVTEDNLLLAEALKNEGIEENAISKNAQQSKITSTNTNNTTEEITSQQAYNIAANCFKTFNIFPEGEHIDTNILPKEIVNNFYLFYSQTKSDNSTNSFSIGVSKITGVIIFVYPNGIIQYLN